MRKMMIILMMTVFGMGQGVNGQNTARYKAIFMYNFTRYIQWPSSMNSQEFIIGVIGKSDVYSELQKVLDNKKIGSSPIIVKQFNNINEIGKCNILFVSDEVSSQVAQLSSQFQNKSTLLITERSGLSRKGASICFAVEEGKQKFEISKSNIEKSGLLVNNQLLDMGIITD